MFPDHNPNDMGPDNYEGGGLNLPYVLCLILIMVLAVYGAHYCFKSLADAQPHKTYNAPR